MDEKSQVKTYIAVDGVGLWWKITSFFHFRGVGVWSGKSGLEGKVSSGMGKLSVSIELQYVN